MNLYKYIMLYIIYILHKIWLKFDIVHIYYNKDHTSCITKELSSSSPGHNIESIL